MAGLEAASDRDLPHIRLLHIDAWCGWASGEQGGITLCEFEGPTLISLVMLFWAYVFSWIFWGVLASFGFHGCLCLREICKFEISPW